MKNFVLILPFFSNNVMIIRFSTKRSYQLIVSSGVFDPLLIEINLTTWQLNELSDLFK